MGGRGVPAARLHAINALARDREGLVRAGLRSMPAGIAALAIGFALGLQTEPPGVPVFAAVHSAISDLRAALGSQIPDSPHVHLASLSTQVASESATEDEEMPPDSARSGRGDASFNRLSFDPRLASFEERFAGAATSGSLETEVRANSVLLSPDLGEQAATRLAARQSAPDRAPVSSSPLANPSKKRLRTAEAPNESSSPPDADARTAIYDIAAHTVYLPNGRRLEAHSGLGSHLDDPRYVNAKGQGPTPPNVYALSLREQRFHGVRAIRLIPVGDGNMFGRDGMLAHSYMLGPNGQSNGCVSFSDYPAFLNAFLSGEIERLVVVEHLATTPASKTASGWLTETIKAVFSRS